MFCSQCGAQIPDNAKFCTKCGSAVFSGDMGNAGYIGNSVNASVIQQNKLSDALNTLDEKFKTVKGGKGIAYTIPLTSVVGKLIFGFLSNNKTFVKEENK